MSRPPSSGEAWAFVRPRPVGYAEALRWQLSLHAARLAGRVPDVVLWLVHEPVITLGRRGRREALLRTPEELAACGVELHVASRGGDATYHGPGQWVVYPILRLGRVGADAHGHLWNLEELSIRTCADFGVAAWRRPGMAGAWTASGKIAAIGFHLRRWVTLHGTSFNVDPCPNGFEWIVPCGLRGEPVASLRTCLGGHAPSMDAVAERMLANFEQVFGRRLTVWREGEALPPELAATLAAQPSGSSADSRASN
ncbi:MAG: lipoyl(octanoyl) transferase LipB [Kiritimatiellae bacterium]|nr:lipoyl(octanoyl) transferase LipB [Kiritimatiellia bacterium]